MPNPSARPWSKTEEAIGNVAMMIMSKLNIWVFRASAGRIGNRFRRGAPVLLLTTTGRKSGAPRTAPLIYIEEGEDILLVASKGGMAKHPLWYLNALAHPEVEIQIGSEVRKCRARRASDEEKAKLWPKLVSVYRDYDDYQARTERNIPVLILSPR